jgi:AcrR family transcriptional regulator
MAPGSSEGTTSEAARGEAAGRGERPARGETPRGESPARGEAARGTDTRARIQQVAVELFAEQGYEKTSLREIAGRLDVTKAALYYHFKSKEDIVASLVADYVGQIDALIGWAAAQPRTADTRAEVLRRYVSIVSEGDEVFRMLHQNQAAVHTLASAKGRGELFRERLSALIELLTGPDADLPDRLRAAMALGGVSVGWTLFAGQGTDRTELAAAVLEVVSGIAGVTQPVP